MVDVQIRHSGGLPSDLTSFVGRRRATADLKQLVTDGRLVTLTGMGGVGKSRLAVHVAREAERLFPDGVWFAELTEVADPEALPSVVLAALGVPCQSARDAEKALLEHLANRRLLLVLDGCERLLDACGQLVRALFVGTPRLTILATSRAPLRLPGEQVWPVPPMSIPGPTLADMVAAGPSAARQYEALALFEDRAVAVLPGFAIEPANLQAVALLCQQLDGLPLAIELAAVWMRSLSVEEILTRLTDPYRLLTTGDRSAAPRHRTLRASTQWSFDLCSEIERTLWARLSVFSGGFELDDAEAVCSGDGVSEEDVFRAISGLVDKSVLEREGQQTARARYRLPNLARDYGRERLRGQPVELPLRHRHRDRYLRLAERADAEWFGSQQVEWLSRLRTERENLWTALEFSLTEPGEGEVALRLAVALRFLWLAGDLVWDGWRWLDRALAVALEPTFARIRALALKGLLTTLRGDPVAGMSLVDDGRRVALESRQGAGPAFLAQVTGLIKLLAHDLDAAAECLEQALGEQDPQDPDGLAVLSIPSLATVSILQGDVTRGLELCERGGKICDEHGELWVRSWIEAVLGFADWTRGNFDGASAHLQRSLRVKHRLLDVIGIAVCLEVLAWVAAAQGDATRAARLMRARLTVGGQLFRTAPYTDWHEKHVSTVRRMLQGKEFRDAEEEGAYLTLDEAVGYALGTASVSEPLTRLTRREWEVAKLVARGLSNREIAQQLVISKRTSDSHVEHILAKLGFASRAEIATWIAEKERAQDA